MTNKKEDNLEPSAEDHIVAVSRAIAGTVPGGSFLAEIIGYKIPNQRLDRVVEVLKIVKDKVDDLEERLKNPENLDLFEDAMIQAGRSIKDERRVYIANMLKNGLKNENNTFFEKKKLFSILAELNEIEIINLKYLSFEHLLESEKKREQPLADLSLLEIAERKKSFYDKHRDLLSFSYHTTNDTITTFSNSYMLTLEKNGLLVIGEETTVLGSHKTYDITPFGVLFLEYIEIPDD